MHLAAGPKNDIILGMPFMRTYTTTFDHKNRQLGFVHSAFVDSGDRDDPHDYPDNTDKVGVRLHGCRENCAEKEVALTSVRWRQKSSASAPGRSLVILR